MQPLSLSRENAIEVSRELLSQMCLCAASRHWHRSGAMSVTAISIFRKLAAPQSVRIAVIIGWVSRGIMAVSQIFAIRILTTLLGVSGYAAYAIIIGLQFWFTLSDFGFGASMQNKLSRKRLQGTSGNNIFAATVFFLAAVGIALCMLVLLGSPFIGPAMLRRIPDVSAAQATVAFAVFGIVMIVGTVASMFTRVLYAEHRAHLVYILTAIGNLAGLALISVLPYFHLKSPLVLAIILYNGAMLLVIVPFLTARLRTVLSGRAAARRIARSWRDVIGFLWKQAKHFLFINIIGAFTMNIDFIILSQFAPVSEIASYAIVARLFAFVMSLFASVTMALWPQSAEAIARKDVARLRKVMIECLSIGFVLITGCAGTLYCFRQQLIAILSPQHAIVIPLTIVAASWLYWCTRVWCDTNFLILQSGGRADLASRIAVLQMGANAVLEVLGAKFFGVGGMLLGLTASFLMTSFWYLPLVNYRNFLTMSVPRSQTKIEVTRSQ